MSRLFTETSITFVIRCVSVPVAAWSKAWVRGRSLAGIAGSNPTVGLDVSLVSVCVLSEICASGVLPSVVCLSVIAMFCKGMP